MSTDFYDRLLFATLGPVVVVLALGGTYAISRLNNGHSDRAMRVVRRKHLSALTFIAFFVYSSVSFTIFQTFVCETLDDGVAYLRADYIRGTDRSSRMLVLWLVCIRWAFLRRLAGG